MVRKMAWVGCFYAGGLFFASFLTYSVDLIISVGLTILAFGYTFFVNPKNSVVPVCVITAAIAIMAYGVYEETIYKPILKYDQSTAVLEGTITDMRYYSEENSSYIVRGKLDGRSGTFMLYCKTLDADYYDTITATGKLKRFEDTYAFPAESYNKSQGIYIEMVAPSQVEIRTGFSILREIMHYRDYLYERICSFLPGEEGAALNAMLCGDKTGLDSDTKTLLYRSGIGHIMSVSGVHISILTALVFSFLKNFAMNRWLRFGIMETLTLAFAVFAGLSESVIRAAVMVTIVYGAGLFKRQQDTFNSLGIFLVCALALEPFAIHNASLVLSSAGVLGIGVIAPAFTAKLPFYGIKSKLVRGLADGLCVTVTLFPFSILFFDEISLISPLTNFILMPFCSIALVCGVLLALTGGVAFLAFPLLMTAGLCSKVILAVSKWVGSVKWFYLPAGYHFLETVVLLSIAAVTLCYFFFRERKKICITVLTCMSAMAFCVASVRILQTGTLTVTVLGNEDGSSLLISDGDEVCILDLTGGRNPAKYNQKYLRRAGISDVRFLALLSLPEPSIAVYAKRFQLFEVDQIFVPAESQSLLNQTVLGVAPEEISLENPLFDMGNYQIQLTENNTVQVVYGDFSLTCLDGKGGISTAVDDLTIFYSSAENTVDSVNVLSLGDDFAGYEISCQPDGEYDTRRITYGSRQ